MKRWLLFAVGVAIVIAATAAAAVAVGEHLAQQRAQRVVKVAVRPVAYRSDAPALERGRYLYASRGCADCHGGDGSGRTLVDDGNGTRLAGPNITNGNPLVAAYVEVDWVRSIRHGVSPSGRPLRLMPSVDYNRLTDDDLAALVAYVRQLPPAQGKLRGVIELPLPARVLYGFGAIPDAFEIIDHGLPPAQPVPEGPTAAYGQYVAQMCLGCHGPNLDGGRIPGGPPDWPPAARLTPGADSALLRYADAAAFKRMLKTGQRPDGTPIAVMPFESLAQLSDTDATALFRYLKGLPGA
ncbi:MAG: cytochrome c [Rubrivivax sp.]|nr:cytochrome c [Rubrivivax sp.]